MQLGARGVATWKRTQLVMADVGPSSGSEPGPSHASTAGEEGAGSEGSKKVRKTYTITKQRENWTTHEHQKFLEAVELYVHASTHETRGRNARRVGRWTRKRFAEQHAIERRENEQKRCGRGKCM